MNDRNFLQANLVFTGGLRDNKEKGLDTAAPHTAMEKEDLQKLFNDYFPKTLGDELNTEILVHKVFFDIMYYTGRCGKEGLRSLSKNSFVVKKGPTGKEYTEITFNKHTKKNQGDSMSAAANALHNDHHIITEIPNSILCPVSSFKMYLSLLNAETTAFLQYPNKRKTGYTKEVVGKNPLGTMMKEISEKARLSRVYTNHQIRKTTATGMKESGFSLQQIANVTKHKNLDSLRHYVSEPTLKEKESYNEGLYSYGKDKGEQPPQNKKKKIQDKTPLASKENISQESEIPSSQVQVRNRNEDTSGIDVCNVVTTNQLRQAPNLFQNATFSNCNFNFTLPQ